MAKKVLVITLGLIAILLGLIFLVGTVTPSTFKIHRSGKYHASQQRIWAYLTSPTQPSKSEQVALVSLSKDPTTGLPRWKTLMNHNEFVTYRIVSENPTQFVSIEIESHSISMNSPWNYTIRSITANLTEVSVEQMSRVPNRWIRGIMVITGKETLLKNEHRRLAEEFGI